MLNYISNHKDKKDDIVPSAVEVDQETFYKIKKAAERKRREVISIEKDKNK
jgi:hypothetical protein